LNASSKWESSSINLSSHFGLNGSWITTVRIPYYKGFFNGLSQEGMLKVAKKGGKVLHERVFATTNSKKQLNICCG
jgi:hypothetical protein